MIFAFEPRLLYAVSLVAAVVVLGLEVLTTKPRNLVCLVGIAVLLLVSFLLCESPEKVCLFPTFMCLGVRHS